jgi:hypothetical protein
MFCDGTPDQAPPKTRTSMQGLATNKTYGTVSVDRQNEMSGLQFVEGFADGALPLDTIAQALD